MAASIAFRSQKPPVYSVRLEGFGSNRPANLPPLPLPAVELESTPFGHIKIRIDSKEVIVPGEVLLKAVATLMKTKQ